MPLRPFGEAAAELRAVADQHDGSADVDVVTAQLGVIARESVRGVDQWRQDVAVGAPGIEGEGQAARRRRLVAGDRLLAQVEGDDPGAASAPRRAGRRHPGRSGPAPAVRRR